MDLFCSVYNCTVLELSQRDRLSMPMYTFVDYLTAVRRGVIDLSAGYGLRFVQLHPDSISHNDQDLIRLKQPYCAINSLMDS